MRKGNKLCPKCLGEGEVFGRPGGRTSSGRPLISWKNPWLKEILVKSFVCLTCNHIYITCAYQEDDIQTHTPCGHMLGQRNIEELDPFDPKKLSEMKKKGKIPETKWIKGGYGSRSFNATMEK